MRLSKADDGPKQSVIDFSDDIDGEPDSQGEFTMASLSKPDMPRDFTICTAFMVKAWTTDFKAAELLILRDVDNNRWAYVYLYVAESSVRRRQRRRAHLPARSAANRHICDFWDRPNQRLLRLPS